MATTAKAASHREKARSYELGLHRELLERAEAALEELQLIKDFANTRPYKRTLPDNLSGQTSAAITNAEGVKKSLSDSLAEVEREYSE